MSKKLEMFFAIAYLTACSRMCEILLRPAAVDEMTNNSLLNGFLAIFLFVVCTHLDPALLHYSFASMQRPQAILS
jgi:hypothetical protein